MTSDRILTEAETQTTLNVVPEFLISGRVQSLLLYGEICLEFSLQCDKLGLIDTTPTGSTLQLSGAKKLRVESRQSCGQRNIPYIFACVGVHSLAYFGDETLVQLIINFEYK